MSEYVRQHEQKICANCGKPSGDHDPWPECPVGETEWSSK